MSVSFNPNEHRANLGHLRRRGVGARFHAPTDAPPLLSTTVSSIGNPTSSARLGTRSVHLKGAVVFRLTSYGGQTALRGA
jgi:hypothetical protein